MWVLVLASAETASAQSTSSSDATPSPRAAHADAWRGGILLDEPARDGLRLDTAEAREVAASVSDALLVATMLSTAAVDALAIPLAQDDSQRAWQATTAHVLALGLTDMMGEVVKAAVGRARPFERECRRDPTLPACTNGDSFHSFYSLHTGMAFTSAGFSCAMHLSRSAYGDVAADAASCGVSLALAMTTGLLRIAADRHYLSDVIVGAVLGFLVGYLVPLVLVPPRADTNTSLASAIAPAQPLFAPGSDGLGSIGISVSGRF